MERKRLTYEIKDQDIKELQDKIAELKQNMKD